MIIKAERWWACVVQGSMRSDDKFEVLKRELNLFQDPQGMWRCKGRIYNADVPYSTKFPILLPNHHHFTELVVLRAHERVFHNGVKETLTEVRSQYWITNGRSVIQKMIYDCSTCQRLEALAYCAPPLPPLLGFRVTEAPAFSYVGVDFTGPLYIRRTALDTGSNKVWICLYTCCITRGIHLDLMMDLTTEAFLRSFKRFIARRGVPSKVVSDNGKTFVAAAKILTDTVVNEVKTHLAPLHVKWTFNIERAPWWGGVFERMVKSVKRCLRKVVAKASLSFVTFVDGSH